MSPFHLDYSNMRQTLLQAIVIVCFGIGVGLTFNYPLLTKAFNPPPVADGGLVSEPAAIQEPRTVVLAQVEQLQREVLLIDARISELYSEGHIPGAVSLPFDESEALLAPFKERTAKQAPVIIYCSGYGCPDSFDLALLLMADGYLNVSVFEGGYPQWRDAGKPVETDLP
jgi:rhodanese-related sulfurtransferase